MKLIIPKYTYKRVHLFFTLDGSGKNRERCVMDGTQNYKTKVKEWKSRDFSGIKFSTKKNVFSNILYKITSVNFLIKTQGLFYLLN